MTDLIRVSATCYRIEDAFALLLPGDYEPPFEPVVGCEFDDEMCLFVWVRLDRPRMPIETTWHLLGYRRGLAQTWITSAVIAYGHGIVQTASGARYGLRHPATVPSDLMHGVTDWLERALRSCSLHDAARIFPYRERGSAEHA